MREKHVMRRPVAPLCPCGRPQHIPASRVAELLHWIARTGELKDFGVLMFSLVDQRTPVVGTANDQSIAWSCSQASRAQGADFAVTFLRAKAEPYLQPLDEELQVEITARWGRLVTLLRSIAFDPRKDLQGPLLDRSTEGFSLALDVRVHTFLRMIRLAELLIADGGKCLSVSCFGSSGVVRHYNIMGPVKAPMEGTARYAVAESMPRQNWARRESPSASFRRIRSRPGCGLGNRTFRRADLRGD